jgi:hypothetical protein
MVTSTAFFALVRGVLVQAKEVLPIVGVVVFFQTVVVGQPLAELVAKLGGLALLIAGLAFFVRGLELALFPAGESIGQELVRRGSLFWLFTFAFAIGFGSALAEPALIAVANQAAVTAAQAGYIADTEGAHRAYALGLRLSVSLGVGAGLMLGVLRTVKGWPVQYLLALAVVAITLLMPIAPRDMFGVALDSGGLTLSTLTVPLITALGVGLAASIGGRNPMVDGFGLVAFAAVVPVLFVLGFGILVEVWR